MSGVTGYPYSIMGYPYQPYLQLPMLAPQTGAAAAQAALGANLAGVPTAAAAAAAATPYGTNGIPTYGAQTVASVPANSNMLTQSYGSLAAQVMKGDSAVSSVPNSVPPRVPEASEVEVPEDKDEYIQELIKERDAIESSSVSNLSKSHVLRLLNQEISRLQGGGIFYGDDVKFLDVYREKCTRVTIRVLVPVREHPKFNFVGKLLGPKGNSLKRMQEETLTKMAVLGRGSMRDREKEEELRASGDPKYGHLQEELHVEITAYAPPAEAYARLAFALTEVRKYLIPDSNDTIRQQQMRELEILSNGLTPAGVTGAALPPGAAMAQGIAAAPDSTSQLQLMTSPSILVPSHGYHIPLLPTPPLDTSPSPTITALPTKYDMEDGGGGDLDNSYKDKSKPRNRKFSPY